MNIRIGQSRDIHRLENNNRPLIIAGVRIDYDKGPVSHSDGDVVYHALAEAFLGSLSLGDLGSHFPDNDMRYKDINSENILRYCYSLVQKEGYRVINIDANIILERPKLKDYLLQMRSNIARILDIDIKDVSLKAQTNEKCGEIGNNQALESVVSLLICKD